MLESPHPTPANRLLARLSPEDLALLEPHMKTMELPAHQRLETGRRQIDHIYFLENGLASVVADGSNDRGIEVGMIGWEGMTGLAVVMDADSTPFQTRMQLAGTGQRVPAAVVSEGMEESATLRRTFLNYAHAFFVQTAHTAVANGQSKIEERLARWLLMAHDRVDSDELSLTHELLAMMLGVRRPGVTVALNLLEEHGLIQANRGVISIIDREGLEENSNGAYGPPEAEFQRLFG
jgi:CRP-like cAMP-binding protein